ncbi:hypothetical protein EGT07_14815 [Herbaspirillum sp. HC18]|nr:hypothetical protein EGT07_14815 [Herbaspirillum sp. HC18]
MANDPLTRLGSSVVAGNDPDFDKLPSLSNGQTVDLSSKSLDSSGWLGGGSCFADKRISVLNQSILIPLSQVCDYLIGLRYALMVVAALVSFRIVSGTILRE